MKGRQEKKLSPAEEIEMLIKRGNSFVSFGKKKEAVSCYEDAKKIFESNREQCRDYMAL